MAGLSLGDEPLFIDINKVTFPTSTAKTENKVIEVVLERLESQSNVPLVKNQNEVTKPAIAIPMSSKKRVKCSDCSRTCEDEEKLLQHIRRVHRGENPFQCYMCDYSTYNKCLFEEHVRIHKGIKPYKCSQCPYKTVSKKYAKKHEAIHQRCKECGYVCRNARSFSKHCASHILKKEYKCGKCPFKTSEWDVLKSHRDEHKVTCTHCDVTVSTESLLKKHMQEVHNVLKPSIRKKGDKFKCKHCKWSSINIQKILLHLIHHPKQKVDNTVDVSILKKYGIIK